jgi:hypothetical protein
MGQKHYRAIRAKEMTAAGANERSKAAPSIEGNGASENDG